MEHFREIKGEVREVLLYPHVLQSIMKNVRTQYPNEASGILCGVFLPKLGVVVIKKAYPCEKAIRTRAFVKCTDEDLHKIDALRKKDNAGEFYGWFHSHPIGFDLSATDTNSQIKMQKIYKTFLGAVVNIRRAIWFRETIIRFFLISGGRDITVPYREFRSESDLLSEVVHQTSADDKNTLDVLAKISGKPVRIEAVPVGQREVENLLRQIADLEKDISKLREMAKDLAYRVEIAHSKVANLRRDVERLQKS